MAKGEAVDGGGAGGGRPGEGVDGEAGVGNLREGEFRWLRLCLRRGNEGWVCVEGSYNAPPPDLTCPLVQAPCAGHGVSPTRDTA